MKTQKNHKYDNYIYNTFCVFIIMYLNMYYYEQIYDFFLWFHNYVSKKCIARHACAIFSFSVTSYTSVSKINLVFLLLWQRNGL